MRKSLAIICMVFSIQGNVAFAQSESDNVALATGNEILALCSGNSVQHIAGCRGYIAGYIQGVTAATIEAKAKPPFCVPLNVTVGQTRDILVKALQDRPQIRHLRSDAIMMFVFSGAFPCQPGNSD